MKKRAGYKKRYLQLLDFLWSVSTAPGNGDAFVRTSVVREARERISAEAEELLKE